MFKWLHISDIHLNKMGTETRRMRQKLIPFLKENNIKCKYLFITGDLRYAPEGHFSDETVKFLDELSGALGVIKKNVFIVPGNHDVNRDDEKRNNALEIIWEDIDTYYNPKVGIIKEAELYGLQAGNDGFISIMEEFYRGVSKRVDFYKDKRHPHFTIVADDINVIHMNSSLVYSDKHEKDLIIGTNHLMDAMEAVDIEKPSILISHYSYDYLKRSEQKEIIALLSDKNVQLWFAGHEHDEEFQCKQDYFYEFRCGNLIYEEGDINSSFIFGRYDNESNKGEVIAYEWDRDDGWKKSTNISRKTGKSVYQFTLEEDDIRDNIRKMAYTSNYQSIVDKPCAYETYVPGDNKVPGMTLKQSNQTKKYMGTIRKNNINDNSNDLEGISFKKNVSMETNTFLKSFFKSNSEEYSGYVYINGDIKPFMKVKVRHTYFWGFHHYNIINETMQFIVTLTGGNINYIVTCYDLSGYHDVDERLFHFGKIKKCINSNNIFIKMVGHEENNLSMNLNRNNKEKNIQKKQTEYWIDWVKKISKIEKYYGVKFYLPKKACENDYLAIEVLSDSINGKPCRTLPSLKMKKKLIKKTIKIDEKMYIGDGTYMLNLSLFGYVFKPTRQYVVPGQYVWDKKNSGWIAANSKGIPVGVDFEVSYEKEKNRKLIEYIDFERYAKEFDLKKIVRLDGKKEELFTKYTDFAYSFHNNRKIFLDYQDALYTLYEKGEGSKTLKNNYVNARITDEIVANRLINNVVSFGKKLVGEIDNTMKNVCGIDDFSLTCYKDNLGYYWLNVLHKYSIEGIFLVSIGKDRELYYDYKYIMEVAKEKDDANLLEVAKSFNEYKGNSSDLGITLYDLMRNYSYTVAKIQKEYYEQVYNTIIDYEEKIEKTVSETPDLVQKGGEFNNYITYILSSDNRNIHMFKYHANILSDFYWYKNDADKHFEMQRIGIEKDIFL